jgi:hypothetical protein
MLRDSLARLGRPTDGFVGSNRSSKYFRITFIFNFKFVSTLNFLKLASELSKYAALLFNMVRIICTPQKCSGFNQMEEAKVSFRDVWLDTPCRIHCWCQQKADPVKGLKMSRVRSAKVLTLSESSRTSCMTQKEA